MSDLTSTILFEHPLNEKMRTWLRMEFLLQQLESQRALDNIANALTFFRTASDLIDVLERGEVRTDLLKELERQQQKLQQWAEMPGVDQIALVVDQIKRDPTSRRLVVSAWNAAELPQMALAPCHALFQFYATQDGRLDLQLYQRSADLAVGVPFNIASYALLLELVARATGRHAGFFVHTLGDALIYLNHVDGVRTQLERKPLPLPKLTVARVPDFSSPAAFDLTPDEVALEGYEHAPFIKFPIAV